MRGKLTVKLVAEAKDSPKPFLLKREDYALPPTASGLVWLKVDAECHIHYDVSLSGMGNNERHYELILEMLPVLAPDAPSTVRKLEEFHGNNVEGSPTEALHKDELVKLDSGVSFIRVKDRNTKSILMSASLNKVCCIVFYIFFVT